MLYRASQAENPPLPHGAFVAAWANRELIVRLARKELVSRLKGSVLGWAWLAVAPLVMLLIYTLIFTRVLNVGSAAEKGGPGGYPLFIFCGLIFFQMFADLALRGPNLLLENVTYIKKVIFPIEVLAWVALVRSLVAAGVSLALLFAFYLAVRGVPPLSALLLPVLVFFFCLMLLGMMWLLSAFGVFLRDLSHLLASVMPALMFVSPIFYSLADVPERVRPLFYLNPLTAFIEGARSLVFAGRLPDWPMIAIAIAAPAILFWLGFAFFARNRSRFVDVV